MGLKHVANKRPYTSHCFIKTVLSFILNGQMILNVSGVQIVHVKSSRKVLTHAASDGSVLERSERFVIKVTRVSLTDRLRLSAIEVLSDPHSSAVNA